MELLTLLLVDDEPIILKRLTETYHWKSMGFQVVGAVRDGDAALREIEEKQPDVVLTDVRMKKMDGLTLIERAKEAGWKTNFVVISAYRDFEYAQKACQNGALSYLVKPINDEELERTMSQVYETCTEKKYKEKNYTLWEKMLVEDRENFLNHMLGRYLDGGITEKEISDLFVSLSRQAELEHRFVVVTAGIDIAQQVVNRQEFDMKQYLLDAGLYKRLKEKYQVWTRRNSDASCYIVDLSGGGYERTEEIKSILRKLRLEIGAEVVSALSSPQQGIGGMKEAYREALQLFEMAGEAGAGLLVAKEYKENRIRNQYSLDVETQILAAMRKNAQQQLRKSYEKFIYTLPGEEDTAKTYLHRLAVRVEFALEESYGLTGEMQNSFANFYQTLGQVSLLKLVDILHQLFIAVIDRRLEMETTPSDEYFKDYIPMAVDYIHEHLQDESLSITGVSESVFLNPVYFGRMFKKVMNMSFKRYVQNVRIEKAKELLQEGRESIADVCVKVGIYNPSYFSQLFKQSTGVLPSEYKRSLEQ